MTDRPKSVKEALKKRSQKLKANDFVEYDVKAAHNIETRACRIVDIAKADEAYKLILTDRKGKPFVVSANNPDVFPRFEWECTPYSLDVQNFKFLKEDPYERIRNWLDYLFWDTSTSFMVSNGLPTESDINKWITMINERKDLTQDEKGNLVRSCKDYATPVKC